MWFLLSQLVTAALSGAFGEEAKEPKDPAAFHVVGKSKKTHHAVFFFEGAI